MSLNFQVIDMYLTKSFLLQHDRTIELKKSIRWSQFDDGFPNLFIDDVRSIAGCDGMSCKLNYLVPQI